MDTTLTLLNQATTMRNLDRNRARSAYAIGDKASAKRFAILADAWEMKAVKLARVAGTRLIPVPNNPRALVTEVFEAMLTV